MGILSTMLATAERRATKQSLGHPLNADPTLIKMFGGGTTTSSGVDVTADTVVKNSAILCGLRVISEAVAMLPLKLHRKTKQGERIAHEDATERPLYELLHRAPNPEITSFEFREWMQNSLIVYGNAYAEIERNGAGAVIALWPLQAGRMIRVDRINKRLSYTYQLQNGESVSLDASRLLHIRGFYRDGLLGEALISLCPDPIGLGMALDEFAGRYFQNGANFSGVFVYPGKLKPDAKQNLKGSIEDHYAGLSNAHRIMVLEEGLTWQQTGVSPESSQLIQCRQYSITQASQILNVKPHMLMDLSRATFSNIEQQGLEFVTYSLGAWLARWEQRLDLGLLTERERAEGYYVRFNANALLRGDLKSRYEAYSIGRQNKWLSANDVREKEDMNPIPGDDGEIYENPVTAPSDNNNDANTQELIPDASQGN